PYLKQRAAVEKPAAAKLTRSSAAAIQCRINGMSRVTDERLQTHNNLLTARQYAGHMDMPNCCRDRRRPLVLGTVRTHFRSDKHEKSTCNGIREPGRRDAGAR